MLVLRCCPGPQPTIPSDSLPRMLITGFVSLGLAQSVISSGACLSSAALWADCLKRIQGASPFLPSELYPLHSTPPLSKASVSSGCPLAIYSYPIFPKPPHKRCPLRLIFPRGPALQGAHGTLPHVLFLPTQRVSLVGYGSGHICLTGKVSLPRSRCLPFGKGAVSLGAWEEIHEGRATW